MSDVPEHTWTHLWGGSPRTDEIGEQDVILQSADKRLVKIKQADLRTSGRKESGLLNSTRCFQPNNPWG